MEQNISIKDIAEMCGVSVATVSRVINNNGRISQATREKVKKVIEETGYRPSELAAGLRSAKTRNIGIIVPDITNEFFARITLAAQNELMQQGYGTLICNTDENPEVQKKQLSMLKSSCVAGMIFISGEDISDEQMTDGIPKVFVDRIPWNAERKGAVTVRSDGFEGARLATEELIGKGCRKIAALFDGRALSTQVERYSGYIRAHKEAGLEVPQNLYLPVDGVKLNAGYKAIHHLLDKGVEFDGIFCYSDPLAMGALHALCERGIKVPEQVKIVGYDDSFPVRFCNPALTSVAQPVEEMGRKAAELLLKMEGGEEVAGENVLLPVMLMTRRSTENM